MRRYIAPVPTAWWMGTSGWKPPLSLWALSLSLSLPSLSFVSVVVHTLTVHYDWLSRAVTLH